MDIAILEDPAWVVKLLKPEFYFPNVASHLGINLEALQKCLCLDWLLLFVLFYLAQHDFCCSQRN